MLFYTRSCMLTITHFCPIMTSSDFFPAPMINSPGHNLVQAGH